MTHKKFLILLSALLISFMLMGCAFAADVDLGEGYHVPQGFSSILITSSDGTAIQNAVDNIVDGGTVFLSGDFNLKEAISIRRNLTLKGVTNALLNRDKEVPTTFCIIKCERSNDITLENLTIIGGNKTKGGGVNISGGIVRIISCDIHDNFSWGGGGAIYSNADTLILTSCDIHNNKSAIIGGGIAIGGSAVMIDCNITSNEAGMSGGGLSASKSNITMKNCTITENGASFAGTGVKIIATKLEAENCNISSNFIVKHDDKGILIPIYSEDISYDSDSEYITK